MLVPYLRSSAIGTYKFCEHQYYLQYVFGFSNKAGAAATKGTIFHKCAELRALAGMAERINESEIEDDNFGIVKVDWAKDYKKTLPKVIEYYKGVETHIDFDKKISEKEIDQWLTKSLIDYPEHDPATLNIIETEKFFDFEIKEPWARYSVTIDGEKHTGHLAIRGTIDTIIDHGDDVYEVLDFKTGRRNDFATDEEKTVEYLKKDHQLLFYLYALNQLYPEKQFIMSLFFINAGGIFSVMGTKEMLKEAEHNIRKHFNLMQNVRKPPKRFDPSQKSWKCKYCCSFSKPTSFTNGASLCDFLHKKISEDGMKKTVEQYADLTKINTYGEGGGRKNDDKTD